ncbi:LysR family transcriptional regulator [Vibrio sp.]|nr:LysR family transcriptional regulator [Vibrio sp.]
MLIRELQQIDLKTLFGLLCLLEERSVSLAARRMFLSQSAMSRLLQKLRDAFGDPLFVRTSHGIQPTPKALALEAPVRQMLEQITEMTCDRVFDPLTSERSFRLQTTHYQAQAYVPTIAERFYTLAPNASLETSTVTETSLIHSSEHNVDAVLGSDYIQIPNSFERRLLGKERFCCIMSNQHPLADKDEITLDDYLTYNHALVNLGSSPKVFGDEYLGERANQRRFTFRTPHFLAALAVVGKTHLLLSSSRLLANKFQQQFNITIKDLPFDIPDTRYYLCWPKRMNDDIGGKWLRQLCSEVVSDLIPYPAEKSLQTRPMNKE